MIRWSFGLAFMCLLFLAPRAGEAKARERGGAAPLVEKSQLTESVSHFVFSLRVGRGPFDEIRVHRVARVDDGQWEGPLLEGGHRGPPAVDTEHAVFLLHGAGGSFANAFLAGTLPSAETSDQSLAVLLAERDIDVWGIDLAWGQVPFETTDLTFMADWGLQRQLDEVTAALSFARTQRRSNDPMHLLGYSLGGVIGYALLNDEAGRTCKRRQVKGWIQLDTAPLVPDEPAKRERACQLAESRDALLADGVFRDGANASGALIGSLALADPEGPSPFAPGLTNRRLALVVAALPQPNPAGASNPGYHFFAGVLDALSGLPVDLAHVPPSLAFEFLQGLGGGPPLKLLSDAAHLACGDVDTPFDDGLGEVIVPVLYVGADGGFGEAGVFSAALLGSPEVTVELIDLVPENRLLDYGHIDVVSAPNAGFLAWEAIATWIREHDDVGCDEE